MEDIEAARIEDAVRRALEATGVDHELLPCDPDFADTAAFCERYGVAPEDSANAIVVVGKSEPRRYVCCVVLATTRLDVNGIVRRRLGVKRASFASADETQAVTGMAIGGVTPLGLPDDCPRVGRRPGHGPGRVVLGGGSRSLKVRVTPELFRHLPNTEIVDDLATLVT